VAKDEVQKAMMHLHQPQQVGPSGATSAMAIVAPVLLLLVQSALQAGLPQAALSELIKKGLSSLRSEEQQSLPAPSEPPPEPPPSE